MRVTFTYIMFLQAALLQEASKPPFLGVIYNGLEPIRGPGRTIRGENIITKCQVGHSLVLG